jgi:hypothetical protein
MKARIVLAGLLVSMMVVEVSAQRAEYDDMYFRGKDREKNKAIDAEEAYASAKTTKNKKQKPDEVVADTEVADNVNPTDSYSARNVNPEYVSRSNSEKASEDEANYYLAGYTPPSPASDLNNSYYNNANQASNSYYANESGNNPYYGNCGCNSSMSPSNGWSTGLSVSLMFGNYSNPYNGYGMYNPSYGYGNSYYGGGYGYPSYYGSNNYNNNNNNNYYNEAPRVNYGKRPSRHSAVVQPAQRTRTQDTGTTNVASVSSSNRMRQRQTQDEYYVRPSRRTSALGVDSYSNGTINSLFTPSTSQPSRTRESYNSGNSSRTPSYTPSSSPSPSRGGNSGGSGGGGSSSPRPRGRN